MFKFKNPLEKEWKKCEKEEVKLLNKMLKKEESKFNQLLEDKVPSTLQETLDKAFYKAFQLIFEKGTTFIEKTYAKEKMKQEYEINEYVSSIKKNRKSLKTFSKKASSSSNSNIFLSTASGVGLGALGVGIPDIALFTSFILRSIYEISLHYGFDYKKEEEKYFFLSLIMTSLSKKEEFFLRNEEINQFIKTGVFQEQKSIDTLIQETSSFLSKELLYMKFIQGIPVIGVIGGFYNGIYLKTITNYAKLKYKRRFLYQKMK